MSVKIKLKGVEETQVKFKKLADLTAVKQALKANTNDLQENTIRRMPSTYVKGYSTSYTAKNTNSYITDNGLTGKVVLETNYSFYVEFGTRYMEAEPVLKPAINEIYPQFISDIKRAAGGH